MGGPTRRQVSSQHSSQGHRDTQAPQPRQGFTPWGASASDVWSYPCLTLFWWSEFSWVPFPMPSTLVCQFLFIAQLRDTSMMKRIFLWYWSQRHLHLFCKFRMTFTWPQNAKQISYRDPDFLVIVRNEITVMGVSVASRCFLQTVLVFLKTSCFSLWTVSSAWPATLFVYLLLSTLAILFTLSQFLFTAVCISLICLPSTFSSLFFCYWSPARLLLWSILFSSVVSFLSRLYLFGSMLLWLVSFKLCSQVSHYNLFAMLWHLHWCSS